jgi:hypothetical protein
MHTKKRPLRSLFVQKNRLHQILISHNVFFNSLLAGHLQQLPELLPQSIATVSTLYLHGQGTP